MRQSAACMECPEGTVKYRLSAARGKIKQGVQDYENTSGIKLYSSGSVALLTAIFVAESQSLVIPNVLTYIFAGAAGLAGTAAGVAMHNKPDTGKHYKDYDIVICDNEYMTLTIDRVYEQGYIPDQEEVEYPIKEDLWNTESNVVRYTVKNNLHKQIFLSSVS